MTALQRMIDRAEDRWPEDASAVPDDTLGQVLLASHLLGSDPAEPEEHWMPLGQLDPEEVPARPVGSEALPPIEDAPGSYVRVRA